MLETATTQFDCVAARHIALSKLASHQVQHKTKRPNKALSPHRKYKARALARRECGIASSGNNFIHCPGAESGCAVLVQIRTPNLVPREIGTSALRP